MWDVVENENYIPTKEDGTEIPIFCESSKEMSDILALTYEGSSQVKGSKINHERINKMFRRFQTIINNLRSLGKTYDKYDHITKIWQSLPRQ
ncbi:hypothetical protein CR513_37732, partial [Mucuna pruriens]